MVLINNPLLDTQQMGWQTKSEKIGWQTKSEKINFSSFNIKYRDEMILSNFMKQFGVIGDLTGH
jgi:hypothetical protein